MLKITGTISKGLGEGAFFMSMEHYKNEIRTKLGFEAYPATLNIKVDNKDFLGSLNPIILEGFEKNGRKFGRIACYKARLSDINGSIINPEVNKHGKNILEFIAPVHVKSNLNLQDGDHVSIELK